MSEKNKQKKGVNYNAKRSGKIAYLCRKNFEMSKQIRKYIKEKKLDEQKKTFLMKLDKNISSCAYHSLYRVGETLSDVTYIASHTCDNRNCNVCNYIRQKKIRKLYYNFFKQNEYLFRIINTKTGTSLVITERAYKKKYENKEHFQFAERVGYDLMHLTLTVPHFKDTGFRGKKFYYSEIIKLYREMRKSKRKIKLTDKLSAKFTDFVYGGEYGIETTKTENGLNIHIHSLLFVRKYKQSRNLTHKLILNLWNNLTVNEFSNRKKFTEEHIASIKKGNTLLSDEWIKKELYPQGATLIGLETIYTVRENKKIRSKEFLSEDMTKAIMETISYHFEPQAFEKKHNEFNFDLLAEILPVIHRQRLYDRFGCIYREPMLKMKNKELTEEYVEARNDLKVDEETGETELAEHYIIPPFRIFHDKEDNERIKLGKKTLEKSIKLDALSTSEALRQMTDIYVSFIKKVN